MSANLKSLVLVGVTALLAGFSTPGLAGVSMSREEREVTEWFELDDPGLRLVGELVTMVAVEQTVSSRLVLTGCSKEDVYTAPDRFVNQSYRSLVVRTTSRVTMKLRELSAVDGRLNQTQLAALLAFRAVDAESRQAFRRYIKTPKARDARDLMARLSVAETFHAKFSIDVATGAVYVTLPHWFAEYLRRAKLYEAFVEAANAAQPGLGTELATLTSTPLTAPVSADARARLASLSVGLNFDTRKIVENLVLRLDARERDALLEWADNPVVRQMGEAELRIATFSLADLYRAKNQGLPSRDPELEALMLDAFGDREEAIRRDEVMNSVVNDEVEGACDTLK